MVCHCRACQKQSGSAFSLVFTVPADGIEITGETKVFEHQSDGGSSVMRHFCPNCGSPIISTLSAYPGLVAVKAGTLDDRRDGRSSGKDGPNGLEDLLAVRRPPKAEPHERQARSRSRDQDLHPSAPRLELAELLRVAADVQIRSSEEGTGLPDRMRFAIP
jgi:hypothetical protein